VLPIKSKLADHQLRQLSTFSNLLFRQFRLGFHRLFSGLNDSTTRNPASPETMLRSMRHIVLSYYKRSRGACQHQFCRHQTRFLGLSRRLLKECLLIRLQFSEGAQAPNLPPFSGDAEDHQQRSRPPVTTKSTGPNSFAVTPDSRRCNSLLTPMNT
jgi:hypothetical protein